MNIYDLIVVGAGPGGYIAAAKAGSLGLKTAIIEKNSLLGGTCLHKGCIPTKFLLHISEQYENLQKIKKVGLFYEGIEVEWNKIMLYKNKIIKKNAYGINHLMTSKHVDVYEGTARLFKTVENEHVVQIFNTHKNIYLSTKNIIFATGSSAKRHFINTDISGKRIMNSDDILNIKKIPKSLIIIGGGVVGCEFASIFSGLGSKITILENSKGILSMSDKDCRNILSNTLNKHGVDIKTKISINNIEERDESVIVLCTNGSEELTIQGEYCLIATGREANINIFSENISQAKKNILINNGLFHVNKYMQTQIPGIFAIGDCINTPWLAHVASAEGVVAAEAVANISNINFVNYNKIPMCVYTNPSIAWCGLTEDDLNISLEYVKISKFPFAKNGKAAIMLSSEGFVKCITDKETNEILGCHIIGKNATELIAEPSFVMQFEATIEEIGATMHAHPTLYESIYETALIALNKPLHG